MSIILDILEDGVFAALAAIGFAAISNPPRMAFKYCALIAAMGHVSRYCLMNLLGLGIVSASLSGALVIGLMSIIMAPRVKCPPETFCFPALLPMIPEYMPTDRYKPLCLHCQPSCESEFSHYFYLFEFNGVTCVLVILSMVVGEMLPILVFRKISFSATR